MDGKRGWFWVIILSPVAAWAWVTSLFQRKKTSEWIDTKTAWTATPSRWTESKWQDFLDAEEKERWK